MAKLTAAAAKALGIENQFLTGVWANIEDAKGRHLRGTLWETVAEDDSDALRALMASKRLYDRELLRQLPHNRRVTVHGFDRRFFWGRKRRGTVVASVLSPLDELLEGGDEPRPVGLNELTEHLRKITPRPKVSHVVGVCSTSGFTEEARTARHEYPNLTLVLVEPAAGGGWRLTADEGTPAFVKKMFDPEDAEQKIDRVRREIEVCSADLLTGGISAESIARRLNLPQQIVNAALEQVAREDPELRVSKTASGRLLYRGAPVVTKEKTSMSLVEKIKEIFAREGDEVGKINLLSERRAALAQRRDRLYGEIGKLEEREAQLVRQGRENESTVVRRRLAAQVAQLRKDIARQNTTAQMLNQQLNIISTDIHNLTLIQQGQVASLPDSEELTQNAVRAEEMLETLKADADLVESLETGIGDVLTSDEERDILAEFEGSRRVEEPATTEAAAESPPEPSEEERIVTEFDDTQAEKKPEAGSADPEAS